MSEQLSHDLIALLGDDGFIGLAEWFGGTRLYVPQKIAAQHEIAKAIGSGNSAKLADRYAGDYLRIPLARELRARHYRAGGLSNAEICRKLGMTETGVDKLFARMDRPPRKGSGQLALDL